MKPDFVRDGAVLGQRVELLIPDRVAEQHVAHRRAFARDPRARPMGVDLELAGRRRDGSEFPSRSA